MKKRLSLLLCALLTLAGGTLLPLAAHGDGVDLTQRKLVWVHNIPVFGLDLRSPNRRTYGAHYPLALTAHPSPDKAGEIIHEAQTQGIDGFAVDTFTGLGLIRPFYDAADRNHFLLAPCFDLAGLAGQDKEARLLHAVEVYCREAASHPGCARQNGAFVVFMYGNVGLPPDAWTDIRATLKKEGLDVFWVGDISVNFNWVRPGVPPDQENIRRQTLAYFPTYDMGYSFVAIPDNYWDTIRRVFAEGHKPFAGGMWPGYYRGVVGGKVIRPFGNDALGTALYRGYWRRQILAGLPWTEVATWNDYTEHTDLSADTSLNVTRGEVTAWYAAQFKGLPPPFRDARLYVTTPQALSLGQPGAAEALVLNPTGRPVRVTLRLFDGGGAPYGDPVSGVAPPHAAVAVSVPLRMAAVPAGRFLRARARMAAGGDATPSAPILVYDTDPPPGSPLLYYSVPAGHALPGKVGLAITNGRATVSAPPGVAPRLVDLLHDQNLVKTVGSVRVGDPVTLAEDAGLKTTDDNYADVKDHGLYVGRIIDDRNRVGFSDPVFVPTSQPTARRPTP